MAQLHEFGDPREFIKNQQARFFRRGAYSPQDLASQISAEATLAGATEVGVSIGSEWIIIQANIDWLEEVPVDPFENLAPFPPGGPTDATREFLATIFSRGVVTATPAGIRIVKGESHGPIGAAPQEGRIVAFMTSSE